MKTLLIEALKIYYLQLVVDDLISFEELSNKFFDIEIPAGDFFKNYNDVEFFERQELVSKISEFFVSIPEWQKFRIWEMSRNLILELKEDWVFGVLDPQELKSKIQYYSQNTLFEDPYLYPQKYIPYALDDDWGEANWVPYFF